MIAFLTDRLTLRPLAPEDFEHHAEMMAAPEVAQFLTLDHKPPSRENAWRAFAAMLGHWSIRGFGYFSVFEQGTNEWVGRVGPWMPEGWPGLECGWGISRAHWGKGYAAEAAIAATKWVFEQKPNLPRIISLIDPANRNSQRVAEKIGETKTTETFVLEQSIKLDIWAAEREDWLRQFS